MEPRDEELMDLTPVDSNNNNDDEEDVHGPACPRRLYVGNLCFTTTKERLREYFATFGTIEVVSLPLRDGNRRKNNGFAFIQFVNPQAAEAVLAHNGGGVHLIDDREVTVNVSEATKQRRPTGPVTFFISPLRSCTTTEMLRQYFGEYGRISEVYVVHERVKKRARSCRFGYVTFEDPIVATKVRGDWKKKHYIDGACVRLEYFNLDKEYERCLGIFRRWQRWQAVRARRAIKQRISRYRAEKEGGSDEKERIKDFNECSDRLRRLSRSAILDFPDDCYATG
uniref:RRM domain-containing protein n=1 Tax=Steinernema glaseri TaxID=37863 RepID=A0A1I8ALA0_9BILA